MPGPKQPASALDQLRAEYLAEQGALPAGPPAGAANPGGAQPGGGQPGVATAGGAKAVPGRPRGGKPWAARPKPSGRPRTGARVAAVQALYQSEYNAEAAEAVIQQFVHHRLGSVAGDGGFENGHVPDADARLFSAIVRHAARHGEALDQAITGHLQAEWPMAKLDPVLRALLRAAAAELHAGKEPPARVVINEYLDVAHGFFGGDEPRFANGVLNALARALRPEEFAGPRP